eukprot:CAMPEP_0113674880 /NCGR_PEP_ID=MMETSP0038_2-20120614/7690_1 /TAXON_ID=2898 /ORGANISM="Cryptomonas paramecium" /LENGTH=156 /DNA_ID=CAMNT_0000591561 /DNA_START=154 /DNA_END=624 /DNA_ORIENTATION=- /assembly_acc=CAM_ASM_000170
MRVLFGPDTNQESLRTVVCGPIGQETEVTLYCKNGDDVFCKLKRTLQQATSGVNKDSMARIELNVQQSSSSNLSNSLSLLHLESSDTLSSRSDPSSGVVTENELGFANIVPYSLSPCEDGMMSQDRSHLVHSAAIRRSRNDSYLRGANLGQGSDME